MTVVFDCRCQGYLASCWYGVDVCTMLKKESGEAYVVFLSAMDKSCRALDITRVNAGADIQESLQDRGIGSMPSSDVQEISDSKAMCRSKVRTSFEQQPNASNLAPICGVPHDSRVMYVQGINIRIMT